MYRVQSKSRKINKNKLKLKGSKWLVESINSEDVNTRGNSISEIVARVNSDNATSSSAVALRAPNDIQLPSLPPPSVESDPCDSLVIAELTDNSSIHSKTPGAPRSSYLPLKLAIDLVPTFDGKSSVTKFIQKCKIADSRVHPSDKINLLTLIKGKIIGHADNLISYRSEPESLTELISLLKSIFIRAFDVDHAYDELGGQRQANDETAETFGARVCKIMNRALEAAKEHFDNAQVLGINVLLKRAAVKGFIKGLNDRLINSALAATNYTNIEEAIKAASNLEENRTDREALFNGHNFFNPKTYEARVHVVDNRSLCFKCHKPGHKQNDCPFRAFRDNLSPAVKSIICDLCGKKGHRGTDCKSQYKCDSCEKLGHLAADCKSKYTCSLCKKNGHYEAECWSRKQTTCNYCKRKGHAESECFSKKRDSNLQQRFGEMHEEVLRKDLNSQAASNAAPARSEIVIGRSKITESIE